MCFSPTPTNRTLISTQQTRSCSLYSGSNYAFTNVGTRNSIAAIYIIYSDINRRAVLLLLYFFFFLHLRPPQTGDNLFSCTLYLSAVVCSSCVCSLTFFRVQRTVCERARAYKRVFRSKLLSSFRASRRTRLTYIACAYERARASRRGIGWDGLYG